MTPFATLDGLPAPFPADAPCSHPRLAPAARDFLRQLLDLRLVTAPAARDFLRRAGDRLGDLKTRERFGDALVAGGLLTPYQLGRTLSGNLHGLVLGNYGVLDRIGGGTVGVVFLGEHLLLRRRAAIKVLPVAEDFPPEVLERFHAEIQALAHLDHPHIVKAHDAGIVPSPDGGQPALHYLVMELVTGGDLEQYVYANNGPLPVGQACEWICQAATGLQEAHDRHLIHRDLKPSNLLLADDGKVKLVDFGLARQFCSTMTEPKALLGSLEFMSPEQSMDPTAVAGPTDVYGLGATLFWLLTGETPFPRSENLVQMMRDLQNGRPRRVRDFRRGVPAELDLFIDRMLSRDPAQRPPCPAAVGEFLSRFAASAESSPENLAKTQVGKLPPPWRALIADNDPAVRKQARAVLEPLGCDCREAAELADAARFLERAQVDLVLLKHRPPGADAFELCKQLRERPATRYTKVVLLSVTGQPRELAEALAQGADDWLAKPVDVQQLAAKARYLLRLKDAQDRAAELNGQLTEANRRLEASLEARAAELRKAQDALLFGMAKMAESREGEGPGHLRRLQRYCACLAEHLRTQQPWAGIVDRTFLETLKRCVPLHDIGKIALPDQVLLNPEPLTPAECRVIQTHTLAGVAILEAIGREFEGAFAFLGMALAIVRHHHERWDGSGYPDGLGGENIPPAARLVALADAYDALRCPRPHKPSLVHNEAVRVLLRQSEGQFDPTVLGGFAACHERFEQIFRSLPD